MARSAVNFYGKGHDESWVEYYSDIRERLIPDEIVHTSDADHAVNNACGGKGVNRQIIGIARDAARIYAATGDMRYGQMATDGQSISASILLCEWRTTSHR